MYRIARLAELLNVTTVQIHEKLILHKEELASCMEKENGITLVTDGGLLILKHIFEQERIEASSIIFDVEIPERLEEKSGSLSPMDKRELELLNLRDRISSTRSELHRLNIEGRKLDEAIAHYMSLLKEEISRRIREEDQLEGILRLQSEGNLSAGQMSLFSGGRK